MSEHYIKRCKNCQTVMGQCRCPGPKSVIWELCEKCKISQSQQDRGRILMKECAWCKQFDLDKDEYMKPDDMVGAVDIAGNWICDDCRDAAESEGSGDQS